jgi:hypothetical protein
LLIFVVELAKAKNLSRCKSNNYSIVKSKQKKGLKIVVYRWIRVRLQTFNCNFNPRFT